MQSANQMRPKLDQLTKAPLAGLVANMTTTRHSSRYLKMSTLLSATSLPRCYVILVIGAPSYKDLTALLLSGQYAHSLVIIATHQPPDIPHIVIPALRILHLSEPLANGNASAARLLHVFEWAERVARDWRKYGGSGIAELSEAEHGHPKPTIDGSLGNPANFDSRRSSVHYRPNKGSVRGARPFDAIINLFPDKQSDDAALRQTILITTVSRPFLSAPDSGSSLYDDLLGKCKSMLGTVRSRSGRSASMDLPRTHVEALFSSGVATVPAEPAGMPYLIYLLPSTAAQYPHATLRLVGHMEAFLSAFACSGAVDANMPGLSHAAQPYIMYPQTFGAALDCALSSPEMDFGTRFMGDPWGCEWTVADVVLSGALDNAVNVVRGGSPAPNARAWIAGPEDVVLMPFSPLATVTRRMSVCLPTPAEKTQPAPAPKAGATAQNEPEPQRPESPYSDYSTSYGHELIRSVPSSLHESTAVGDDLTRVTTVMRKPPPDIEETPLVQTKTKMSETKVVREEINIQHKSSFMKIRALIPAWKTGKPVSAWKFNGKAK